MNSTTNVKQAPSINWDAFHQQRQADNLEETIKTVDEYLQDYGIHEAIENLNVLTASLFPGEDGKAHNWNMSFIQEAHATVAHITELLAKLYELRREHLYKAAQV